MFINFHLIFDIVASPPKIEVTDLITAVPLFPLVKRNIFFVLKLEICKM